MAGTFEVKGRVSLDTTEAEKALDTTAEKAKEAGEKAGKEGGGGFSKMALAATAVTTAVLGLKTAVDAAVKRVIELDRAKVFNVLEKDIKAVNAAFGNTLSKMDAMRDATAIAVAGFEGQQKQVSELANSISFLTGVSKEAALEQVKAGAISDEFLEKVGLSAQMVENAIKRASVGLGRELTELERRRAVLQFVNKDLAKINKLAGELNKASPFDQLSAEIKSASEELTNKLAPELLKLTKDIKAAIPEIADAIKIGIKGISGIVGFAKGAWSSAKDVYNSIFKGTSLLRLDMGKTAGATKAAADASAKAASDASKKIGDAAGKGAATAADKMKKALDNLRKSKAGKRAAATIKSEILDEMKGFQAETRTIIRDFEVHFLDAISNLGGPVSGIVSSLKDAPELFRKFSSTIDPQRLAAGLDLTTEQIQKMKEQGHMTAKQAKLQTLINLRLKGGVLDLREYITNEKIVNTQLKAGLTLYQSQSQVAAALTEKFNADKDIRGATVVFQKLINHLTKKGGAVNERIVKLLKSGLKQYQEQGRERKRLLDISIEVAKVEGEAQRIKEKFARKDAETDAKQRVLELQRQILDLQGKGTQSGVIDTDAANRVREVQKAIRDMRLEATVLEEKMVAGAFQDAASQKLAQDQIASINSRIKLRLQEIDLIQKSADIQKQNLSLGAQLHKAFADQVKNSTANLAGTLKSTFDGAVGGIGNLISGTMETVITNVGSAGAAAGKMFLDVLAGAAAQLGSYYLAAGAAQMWVPPYTGAGAIAGGAGLLALSGTLKGIGSLIGASAPSVSTPSSGGGSIPSIQQPPTLAGQGNPDSMQPVQFFFSTAPMPWQNTNEQQTAREMRRWGERMASEGVNPFELTRRVANRGR